MGVPWEDTRGLVKGHGAPVGDKDDGGHQQWDVIDPWQNNRLDPGRAGENQDILQLSGQEEAQGHVSLTSTIVRGNLIRCARG